MSIHLQQAINAIKLGDKGTGKRLLTQALQTNPQDETAWLWLAYAVDSVKQRRECLERVLALNPMHEKARRGLAGLGLPVQPAKPCPQPDNHVYHAPPTANGATQPPVATPNEILTEKPQTAPGWSYLSLPWTIALLMITLAIFIGANLIERWAMWSHLAQSGVTTRATIVDSRTGAGQAYYVTYRFTASQADGKISTLQTEEQVSQELYHLLEPGSRVKIQYLFENPVVVRLGGRDSLNNLIAWTVVALVTGVTGFSGLAGILGGIFKQSQTLFKRTPTKPKIVWQGEGPPPLKQWTGTYTLGQDNYEGYFVIETDEGIFLGEGGLEIFKAVPDTNPKQPIAFDVGLFDKTDITTLSRIIMSDSAYLDQRLRTAIAANPHAEAILARLGAQFTLESTAMRVEATIDELEYDPDSLYFTKLTVSLAIFVKEGIDLARPMDIPDQFK